MLAELGRRAPAGVDWRRMERAHRLAQRIVVALCRRGGWRRRGPDGRRWWERHAAGRIGFGGGARHEGDEVLLYLELDAGRAPTSARGSPLCWLGFADRLHDGGPPPAALAFDRWVVGTGAALLDALTDELRGRWAGMRRGGDVLHAFLDAAERAGRRDLGARVAARSPLAAARLAAWGREARAVRFFDDDYPAAQALLHALEARR
jgi:hypothetical protein